ncbi:hypothetical protein [Sulfitobacter sp. SK011]|uniref:hypothetical protein n=1 Tax=Sulfitobacter sp. SK011 TaxID=1389004 RepID=UPI0013B385F0|nr:hypothetical protein [Sulfitobacter sp. SK011]
MIESKDQNPPTQDPLEALVRKTIETQGQEFEGYVWAIQPLQDWADQADVSLITVKRKFSKAPYDTLCKQVEGKNALLVRVGVPDPNQPSRLASEMGKAFRNGVVLNDKLNAKQQAKAIKAGTEWKPKKSVTRDEYGCLHGLAKDWRAGWQLQIFKHTITPEGWATFMVEAKNHMKIQTETESFLQKGLGYTPMVLDYPHLKTLRLFWMCAEYAFVEEMFVRTTGLDQPWTGMLAGTNKSFWQDWDADLAEAYFTWMPQFKAINSAEETADGEA